MEGMSGYTPAVEIASGRVRGAIYRGVQMFRGIPYGAPTEGAARFLLPSRPQPWTGTLDAVVNPPRCVQAPGNIFDDPRIGR